MGANVKRWRSSWGGKEKTQAAVGQREVCVCGACGVRNVIIKHNAEDKPFLGLLRAKKLFLFWLSARLGLSCDLATL